MVKIYSTTHDSWLYISNNFEDFPSFAFSACIDYGHAKFTGENRDISFENITEFLSALRNFNINVPSSATLMGTYECRLTLSSRHENIFVTFSIGGFSSSSLASSPPCLTGSFQLDRDFFPAVKADIISLFSK